MFTVGFDTSALDPGFKAHAARGIGRYVSELKRYFDSLANDRLKVGFFDHRAVRAPAGMDRLISLLPAGRETVRQQIVYPLTLKISRRAAFNVMHFPAHMDAPSWSMRDYVITVLDLIPLVCADLYKADRPSWRYRLARWLEISAIKNASLILAISENTANDVHRLLSIPRERIIVTPLGVDERFFEVVPGQPKSASIRQKLGVPENGRIVLYVGGIDPRKNYPGMLRAFSAVAGRYRERGEAPPYLVLAGKISGDREFPKLMALVKELGLSEFVRMPGYVQDSDLLDLYAISSVFFFPSLYEGFGLPPLEAMAAGTPVVSSNTSAMPEILGEGALLVSPTDERAAAERICSLLDSEALSHSFREAGRRRARQFTWRRTGDATVAAYERLAANA